MRGKSPEGVPLITIITLRSTYKPCDTGLLNVVSNITLMVVSTKIITLLATLSQIMGLRTLVSLPGSEWDPLPFSTLGTLPRTFSTVHG